MKKPQPDLAEAIRADFISSVGRNRRLKRYWGTTTINSTEVLNARRHYHPESLKPANYEELFKFLGVTESIAEADNEGVKSAWFFLNKSKGKETFKVPSSFIADNLNKVWWDPADGEMPENLTLTTTISIGADFTSLGSTALIDPSLTVVQQAQAVITNYETLWANNKISQEGIGVIDKGAIFNTELKIYELNEDDITPDDHWLGMLSRYALRTDGIPCTIKDVEVGLSNNTTNLYNTVVVTLEIPYHEFLTSDLMVQRILNDNDTALFPKPAPSPKDNIRAAVFNGATRSNEQTTQTNIKNVSFYETEEDVDETTIVRDYLEWEDYFIGTSSYANMWIKYNKVWYLKAEVFTDPRKYGMTHKKLHDYLWPIIDTGYKKKKVPWWKKLIAIIVFIVVAVLTYLSSGATSVYLKVAWALVVAAFTLTLIALVLFAVGANEMAMAFIEVNKAVEPLVQIASIVLIVTGVIAANDAINAAATEAAKKAGTEVVLKTVLETALSGIVDAFIQGIKDLASGAITTAGLNSASKIINAYTMTQSMKLADLNSRNNDLKAEYDRLVEEAQQQTDALQGFMKIYAKPATADWSIYASLFDLPYERGGGALAMGNVQKTTKQAMRKADYEEAVFENMKLI